MSNNTAQEFLQVDLFPPRGITKERFDQRISIVMYQISKFIDDLNSILIPALNNLQNIINVAKSIELGGTGAKTTSKAMDNLGGLKKKGNRGTLSGYEIALCINGDTNININSNDTICITASGDLTLTFEQGNEQQIAIKMISIYATEQTLLTINGAEWSSNDQMPVWGSAGSYLILVANFIKGRVILTVFDNTEPLL